LEQIPEEYMNNFEKANLLMGGKLFLIKQLLSWIKNGQFT
jgi:hypothetical protein